MMRHPTLLEWSRYLDREGGEQQLRQMDGHLTGCQSCRQMLETLRQTDGVLQELPRPTVSSEAEYVAAFQQRLSSLKEEMRAPSLRLRAVWWWQGVVERRQSAFPAIGGAAAVVLAIVVAVGLQQWWGAPVVVAWDGRVEVRRGARDDWRAMELWTKLPVGSEVRVGDGGRVDLVRASRYRLRCEGASELTVEAAPAWPRATTVFLLRQGRCLVETDAGFGRRQLEIRTPSAVATVVGTGFALSVDPGDGSTWLGVAHGTVQFGASDGAVSGEALAVGQGYAATVSVSDGVRVSRLLSEAERQGLRRLEEVGRWSVRLDLGEDSQRVERLFGPVRLFIHGGEPLKGYRLLERVVGTMNRAFEWRNERLHRVSLQTLETLIVQYHDPRTTPQLLLFTGAYYGALGYYPEALNTFDRLIVGYPESEWVGLALCAQGVVAGKMGDTDRAARLFRRVVEQYPDSVDAAAARVHLSALQVGS